MELISSLIEWLSAQVHAFITATGYFGVVLLMAIESCNIPLPSEIILTFTGYLVQKNVLNLHLAAIAGALGCVVGSIPSYLLGAYKGRDFILKHGRWFLVSHHDLDVADRWVAKYGDWAFFICRMLPVVRTFISLPAGILKARFVPFLIFTFIGSLIWSYFLVWIGMVVGENETWFKHIWHQFDALIIGLCLIAGGIYVYKHIQHFRASKVSTPSHPTES
jgi:membrane protein DedA with SNARE-associated domain